jgi:hypothetical protein
MRPTQQSMIKRLQERLEQELARVSPERESHDLLLVLHREADRPRRGQEPHAGGESL